MPVIAAGVLGLILEFDIRVIIRLSEFFRYFFQRTIRYLSIMTYYQSYKERKCSISLENTEFDIVFLKIQLSNTVIRQFIPGLN